VSSIQPVMSDRVIVRLSAEDAARKQEKWQRQVLEACKQCGQPWLPRVEMPQRLAGVLQSTTGASLRLCAALLPEAKRLPMSELRQHSEAAVLIGPEGDFTAEEYGEILAAGWTAWDLGEWVLRSETAALACVTLLRYAVLIPPP
jgi:16S rRNA (uracil1498-N3)-methyltransferase